MLAAIALLGTGLLLIPHLHTEFFPKIDAGNFTMLVTAPEGSRIEKTTAIVTQIEGLVQEVIPKSDLEEVISNTGLYFGDAARFAPNTGNHTAFILVNLLTGHEGRTEDYIAALRQKLQSDLPGVEVAFQTGGIIGDVLNFGLKAPIDIQVKGPQPRYHQAGSGTNPATNRPGPQYRRCAHQAGEKLSRIAHRCGSDQSRLLRY